MRVFLRSALCVGFMAGLMIGVSLHAKPMEIDVDQSKVCEYLGSVSALSGYGKNPNWFPIARTYAEQRAAREGATHYIIRSKRSIGTFNGEVTLDAYRCPSVAPEQIRSFASHPPDADDDP
jgi:hypothetical protein